MDYEREDVFWMLLILGPFNWGNDFETNVHAAGDGDYTKPHSRLIRLRGSHNRGKGSLAGSQ